MTSPVQQAFTQPPRDRDTARDQGDITALRSAGYSVDDLLAMNPYLRDDERPFQQWYARQAAQWGLDADPDNPLHFYDWRAAYRAGARADEQGHWPSTFKTLGHPTLIRSTGRPNEQFDTRTGEPASAELAVASGQARREVQQQLAKLRMLLRDTNGAAGPQALDAVLGKPQTSREKE